MIGLAVSAYEILSNSQKKRISDMISFRVSPTANSLLKMAKSGYIPSDQELDKLCKKIAQELSSKKKEEIDEIRRLDRAKYGRHISKKDYEDALGIPPKQLKLWFKAVAKASRSTKKNK